MFINKSWFKFYEGELPEWQCPTCGKSSLNLSPGEFHVHDSAETEKSRTSEYFDADWIKYRFSATLRCANIRCKETVSMIGRGYVEEDHERDLEGNWQPEHRDCFQPLFFEPYLQPITIPQGTPKKVQLCLNQAFGLIFANHDAAANQLRLALEALLDSHNIKSVSDKGKRIYLGIRIQEYLISPIEKFKVKLSAVRWIGNAGSHEIESITSDDILDGLELIQSVLFDLYPQPTRSLDELANFINATKKPRSHQ